MVGIRGPSSIEANYGVVSIGPCDVVTTVGEDGISLSSVGDHYALKGIVFTLYKILIIYFCDGLL